MSIRGKKGKNVLKNQVIVFAGFAGVGKDTAFKVLEPALTGIPCYRLAFGDALKQDLKACEEVLKKYVKGFDLNLPEFKEIFRDLWISWGTHVARKLCPDIWPIRLNPSIYELKKRGWVFITDARFANEVQIMRREHKATVYYIERPGYGPANPEENTSFAEMLEKYPELKSNQFRIINDGTIEDFRKKLVDKFCTDFGIQLTTSLCGKCSLITGDKLTICAVCNKSICRSCLTVDLKNHIYRCKTCKLEGAI